MRIRKWFNRFSDSYFKMRLIHKFTILFILVWFIPMLFTSYYIYQRITDNLIKAQNVLALQGHQQVESFLTYHLDRILLTSRIIAMDPVVNDILTRELESYPHSQQLKDLSTLRVYLEQFNSIKNKFDRLQFYVPGGRVYSNENKLIFNLDSIKDALWYKNSFKGWGWVTSNPPELMESTDVISVVRPVRDLNNYQSKVGAVRIDISMEEVERMLSRANIGLGFLSYLVTKDGMLVGTSSDELLSSYRLTDDLLDQYVLQGNTYMPIWQPKEKVWVYVSSITNVDWILVTILPEKELAKGIYTVQLQYIIAIALLFFAVVLIAVPSINSITRRLKHLVYHMKLVKDGDMGATLHSKKQDEIGQLINNFNSMLERIQELMKQQYILGQELKTAELKALQSQINPHFLYNTLEMIGWLAYEGSPKKIQSVVNTLAQFFRLSLNRGNDITTIGKELQLVESYMHIQRLRFQERITLLIDVRDIQDYPLPKITLQPIVENAILHGILEKPGKYGTIEILGRLNPDGMIELSITDDGVGMKLEVLDKLNAGLSIASAESSYGLDNIEKRICLFYGIEHALYFQSQPNIGTKVTLRIPSAPYI